MVFSSEFTEIAMKLGGTDRPVSLYDAMQYKRYIQSLDKYKYELSLIPYSNELARANRKSFPKQYDKLYEDIIRVHGDVYCSLWDNGVNPSEIMATSAPHPTLEIYDLVVFLMYWETRFGLQLLANIKVGELNARTKKSWNNILKAISERNLYIYRDDLYFVSF